ncbi:MAG TPA: FAD-dependent oxidoreductase [Nitriliruptorales bacterium]|nr:FAD-dependent oxidoreductase [Nitriliruptorales bacterium]
MTEHIATIVLVGGGLASARAAQTLRAEGFDGDLTLVAEETHRPYERPPLSKGVLIGHQPADSAYVHPQGFYDEHGIELITGDPVTDVDRDAGKVTTRSGTRLAFDRLLFATGASPRQLPLEERERDGILTLRTLDDAQRLSGELRQAGHVTIVGAGWIGCEVAAAARTMGTDVTMVDPLDTPLQRVLGAQVGRVFAQLHRDHGVDLRLGVGVASAAGTGRVEQVTLGDQTRLATDLVVVGIGVTPRTGLAESCGLEVDDGILTDATLATSDPRILAAGDVANAWHPHYRRHLRVEHWANALNQGNTAGLNLLGAGRAYDRLPYFYSDQYDLSMEYVGHATDWDQVVFRGDPGTREFVSFWISEGRVVAAMNANVQDVVNDLKSLILSEATVDPARLADPDVPLVDLLRPGA